MDNAGKKRLDYSCQNYSNLFVMKKIFLLFTLLLIVIISGFSQGTQLPPRPQVMSLFGPFYHGVASGDPLTTQVIIWTRVTPATDISISVDWQVANDANFSSIVNSGTIVTDSSFDYCVKVDVTGLQPDHWYYYRFKAYNIYSLTGRTRTLPVGNVDSLRFAVFSCSDFQTGYFNAYQDISQRNDLDALMHLGDWYYEYAAGGSDYQGDTSRLHPLTHDAVSLNEYRLYQSQYRLESGLRNMLQQYPIIQIWDDHEIANNSWYSGAENHNPTTQGDWYARKRNAKKAIFEWNPIRPIATGNDTIIHRNFKWGNLLNLIMLDTRFEGRDSSLGQNISTTNAYLTDPNRNMLGPIQLNWLKNQLSDTTVQWRIVGSQVMIAPLTINLLLTKNILNGDQWDGYPAERKRVLDHIAVNNIKDVVFLSGDIHCSWANDLPHPDSIYNSSTGGGSIATEFIGSSITSSSNIPGGTQALIQSSDNWVKYNEFTKRGYLLFDVNKTRAQGDFIHISNIATTTYITFNDAHWMNLDGERHLRIAPGPLGPNTRNPPLVSPNLSTGINQYTTSADLVVFSCFPNPTADIVNIQYSLNKTGRIIFAITDNTGKTVFTGKMGVLQSGSVNITEINLSDLPNGVYTISLSSSDNTYSKRIVKLK